MDTKKTTVLILGSCICISLLSGCLTPPPAPISVRMPSSRPMLPNGKPLTIGLDVTGNYAQWHRRFNEVLLSESGGLLRRATVDDLLRLYAAVGSHGESCHGMYYLIDQINGEYIQEEKKLYFVPQPEKYYRNEKWQIGYYENAARSIINDLYAQQSTISTAAARAIESQEQKLAVVASGARGDGEVHGVDETTGVHFVYRGGVFKGVAEGKGHMAWDNGDTYTGDFRDGLPNGEGHMRRNRNKQQYKGTFEQGQIIEGTAQYWDRKDRPTFIGKFKNGLPHGPGKLKFRDNENYQGETVEGHFEKGVLQGAAKITYPSGSTLVVNHTNGRRNGAGQYTSASGATDVWTYHNGSFVESESDGQYNKEAANKPKDDLISTALKLQGLVSTIQKVTAKKGGRKFVGKGSPPVNSFDANNKPNAKYFKWAYGE